jgi:hypothetical protein
MRGQHCLRDVRQLLDLLGGTIAGDVCGDRKQRYPGEDNEAGALQVVAFREKRKKVQSQSNDSSDDGKWLRRRCTWGIFTQGEMLSQRVAAYQSTCPK